MEWIHAQIVAACVTITFMKEFGMQLLVRNCYENMNWVMKETNSYAVAVIKDGIITGHLS